MVRPGCLSGPQGAPMRPAMLPGGRGGSSDSAAAPAHPARAAGRLNCGARALGPQAHAASPLPERPAPPRPRLQAPKEQKSKEAKALAAANSSKGKKKVRAARRRSPAARTVTRQQPAS